VIGCKEKKKSRTKHCKKKMTEMTTVNFGRDESNISH